MTDEIEDDDDRAPGWEALDAVLDQHYDNAEPMHWGTVLPYNLGGEDPLYGVSVYENRTQQPHLHYVTFGFSDLFENENEDSEWSGFGFELTFRLTDTLQGEPPVWVVNFLQNLARYTFHSGNGFGPGHTIPLHSPICTDIETEICTVTFVEDPELGTVETPNGKVRFLQVIGLTEDELDATQCWNAARLAEMIQLENPLLITDVDRQSYLADEHFARAVRERTAREGASASVMSADEFRVIQDPATSEVTLVLGAIVAPSLGKRLRGRLPFGRDFQLVGEDGQISFQPGEEFEYSICDQHSEFVFNNEQIAIVAERMQEKAGEWKFDNPPMFRLVVEQTEITDNDGNVTDVVG